MVILPAFPRHHFTIYYANKGSSVSLIHLIGSFYTHTASNSSPLWTAESLSKSFEDELINSV